MEKENKLLFTNKYHALNYIFNNLEVNCKKAVLPSVIGFKENEIFSNYFTELLYYDYEGYSPDYADIKHKIDKDTLLFLRDVYPCNGGEIKEISDNCGIIVRENMFIVNKPKDVAENIVEIGDVNIFFRFPLGVYVIPNGYIKDENYFKLPKTKEPFSFRISSSFYEVIKGSEGVLNLIDENVEKIKKSDFPRLGGFTERRINKIDVDSLVRNFKNIGNKIIKDVHNRHFQILYCNEYVYSSLFFFVRDKTSLFSFLKDHGIKPVNYYEYDSPLNEKGVKFNDSIILVGLANFIGDTNAVDRFIALLNRW